MKELKNIGKELTEYETNAYKKAILESYKEKKECLIKNVINDRESLRIIKKHDYFWR